MRGRGRGGSGLVCSTHFSSYTKHVDWGNALPGGFRLLYLLTYTLQFIFEMGQVILPVFTVASPLGDPRTTSCQRPY
jgi:hypothetical protein